MVPMLKSQMEVLNCHRKDRIATKGKIIMARKQAKPTQESAAKRDLKTPKYRMRVVEDKSKYKRQRDKVVRVEGFRKAA
ncbi:hypothetical protein DYI22_11525 [Marinobacter lipolyticus]|nr:hypothetical protein [Marinobacter lipolyticus]